MTDFKSMTDAEYDAWWAINIEKKATNSRHLLVPADSIAEAWGPHPFPKGRSATCLITIKNLWDNYSNPEGMGEYDSLIYEIERIFPHVEAAHRKRPLGEFKDLLDLPYEDLYDILATRLTDWHETKDGEIMSFAEAIWPHARELMAKHLPERDRLTRPEFFRGLSLMLYGSTAGIWLEGETSKVLTKQIADSKLGKRFRYEEAPFTMEKEDVDGVVIDRKTEEIVCCISIKTMGALSENTVKTYREGKKQKTKPDIYAGFTSILARNAGQVEWIEVGGRSLKDILRDAIS